MVQRYGAVAGSLRPLNDIMDRHLPKLPIAYVLH